jgi:hypothetical protein
MKISSEGVGCEISAERGEQLGQCDPAAILPLIRGHGWVFFSGFDPTVAEYETFTSRFGTCADTRGVHYPPGGEALGFHSEDAYNPYRPDTLWFLCVFEGSDGGAPTGVVDGVRLLDDLGEEWRSFCRANRLRFDRHWSAQTLAKGVDAGNRAEFEALLRGMPNFTYQFQPDGSLYTRYETPLLTRTPAGEESFSNTALQAITEPTFYGMSLADGSPVPEGLLTLAEKLALEDEEHLGWRSGDVVVINNLRMMHRRGEYHGSDRDLRARHCEDLFGTVLPDDSTPLGAWTKRLLQSDEGSPVRVGPLDSTGGPPV